MPEPPRPVVQPEPETLCSLEWSRGLTLEVRDSVSAEPSAEGVVAIAREGPYVDTLSVFGYDELGRALLLGGVHERPGVYEVSVRKPGYRDWNVAGVTITGGECHVVARRFQVRLQRQR